MDYLAIITLNLNKLNLLKEIKWLKKKKKSHLYAALNRLTSDVKTCKTKSEGIERDTPCKY